MSPTPKHLKVLKELEKNCLPGFVELLHKDSLDAVRCVLWDVIS